MTTQKSTPTILKKHPNHKQHGDIPQPKDVQTIIATNANARMHHTDYTNNRSIHIWYENNKQHRVDGPAVTYFVELPLEPNRPLTPHFMYEIWKLNGKRHRANGPAFTSANKRQEWWFNGVLHREDGPAIIDPSTNKKEWWLEGIKYNHHTYKKRLKIVFPHKG